MSRTLKRIEELTKETDSTDDSLAFLDFYGSKSHKGMDIADCIIEKLESGDTDKIWSPVFSKNANEDCGETAGFLAGFGIVTDLESSISTLGQICADKFGVIVGVEDLNDQSELTESEIRVLSGLPAVRVNFAYGPVLPAQ